MKGNWQEQSIFKSVFIKDANKKSYNPTLNSCKTLFVTCGLQLPKDKKVNYSRSAGMNRADDFGAEKVNNDQMSAHDIKGRKNTSCMREDPHQVKHVNSGHFWAPEHQTHWNERSQLIVPATFKNKLFPIDEWNLQRQAPNGDKTITADNFLNREMPFISLVIAQDGK